MKQLRKYIAKAFALAIVGVLGFTQASFALSPEQKQLYDLGVYQFDINTAQNECSAQSVSVELVGDSNPVKAINFLMEQGLSDYQSFGVVGNLMAESSVMPNRKQGAGMQTITSFSEVKPGAGYGIAQWTTAGRQENWGKFAKTQNMDPLSLELQLLFLIHEFESDPDFFGYKHLKAATTLEQATWIFLAFFERPAAVVDAGKAGDPVLPTGGSAREALNARVELATRATGNMAGSSPASSTSNPPTPECEGGTGSTFRIATFNIYYNTDKRAHRIDYSQNKWPERLNRSSDTIKNNNIEVAGLQEVRESQWQGLQDPDRLGTNYDIFPKQYSGYGSQNPIVWDKNRFELVSDQSALIGGYTVTGGYDKEANTQVRLRDKVSFQEFYVINHHEPVGGGAAIKERFDAANARAAYVKDLTETEGVPVFMTGDFNSGYTHRGAQPTWQNKASNLPYCIFTEGDLMKTAYNVANNKPRTCPGDGPGVDHIFMTSEVTASGFDDSKKPRANGSDVHPTVFADVTIPGSGTAGEAPTSLKGGTFNIFHSDEQAEDYWKARLKLSTNVITSNDLDFVGLQEARPDQQNSILSSNFLGSNYGKYPQKASRPDFTPNPVIFNSSRWEIVEEQSKKFKIAYDGKQLDVAVQVKLKTANCSENCAEFYVINTHDPADIRKGSDTIRANNSKIYVNLIKNLEKEGVPIFLTGDFNSRYKDAAHCVISGSKLVKDTWELFKDIKGCANGRELGTEIDRIYATPDTVVTDYWIAKMGQKSGNGSDKHDTIMNEFQFGGSAGGLTSANGFTFPLKTDRKTILNNNPAWCADDTNDCHHDYNASDIFAPTGTPVVATRGGRVVTAKDNATNPSDIGTRISIMGDDGWLYYYAHMGNNTLKVRPGQTIKAGTVLGLIGTSDNAAGTDPHLHIDRLPGKQYASRPTCSGGACSSFPFDNIQAIMSKVFKSVK